MDGAVGSLGALHDIAKAVGDQITIGFDSGIRSGADMYATFRPGVQSRS